MKIENEVYILAKQSDDGIWYLTDEYGFDNDIRCALKCKNKITATYVRDDFEQEITSKVKDKDWSYKSNLYIVPLKITYEWE